MTVGEKIQFYRKRIGLSQEELGQKMLVSRQTVSLWEMDKTVPTVDNLLLLKGIFDVSIDDILDEAEPKEDNQDQAKEEYVFNFDAAELKEIFKKSRAPLIKRAIIFTVAFVFAFVLNAASGSSRFIIGLILGFCLFGIVSHIKGYRAYRKTWKANENKIAENTYSYEVFDGYFVVNISKHDELRKTQKIYLADVEKVQTLGKYLVLQVAGQSYILKKEALMPYSTFIALTQPPPKKKVDPQKPPIVLRVLSIILFVLSICTIFGALIAYVILSEANHMDIENMWVFFLFTPIPIASIIFGFCTRRKGYRYRKNVIVGFIMAILLCLYGSFTFIFGAMYSHSDEPIIRAEQAMGIDIPEHSQINTQSSAQGKTTLRGVTYTESEIYFDDDAVEEFEKNLWSDPKWMEDIPSDLIGITSYLCDMQISDYYIIYNKNTKEFNKLPSKSGTYEFINVMYDVEKNTMKLVEYRIDYNK